MSVIRKIENDAFFGKKVIRRGGGLKIRVVSSGTGAETKAGVLIFSSATGDTFITVDTAGTGTKITP